MNLGQHIPTQQRTEMGFVGFDLEGNIIQSSSKLLQIFNIPSEKVLNVHELFQNNPGLLDAAVDAVQGKSSKLEVTISDKVYLVEMLTDSQLVPNADIIAVFSDISHLKENENSLLQQIEELQERNKELEQLAYITSHDLNEPLRMVSNFAQLLESEYEESLDNDAKTYLKFVVNGSQRVQYLINDLLSYNRASRAKLKPELVQLENIILLQAYKLKESIDTKDAIVEIESSEEIFGDPKWLGEVIHHLLKNAIIFNENTPPKIDINIDSLENETIISVKDNGIGIEEKHQESIFSIMKKVDSRPNLEGSGIGLAICKKIISLHGGKLWVESELDKGSKFIFSLPKSK